MAIGPVVLSAVSVVRDERTVLADIDLTLDDRRIAIIGLNGSGKSTLVRLLNGLLLPTSGEVRVGELVTGRDDKRIRRLVGFVFQNPENQIVMPIVADDLRFGARNLGLARAETEARIAAVLAGLGLGRLADRESHSLSGGEKQLVALAAVLVMQPELIIFDEPTTMLDLVNRRRLQQAIDGLEQRAVLVTHDLELAARYQRVIVLHDGRVIKDSGPDEAIASYRDLCDQVVRR
ncbi:ABC transporter ATP-binding protein [Microlunatus endophyticus]|uniref:ABC transporter ATP-binding protein n=1 Tax=Microlunatus endophyticus TaxID=1716077 RepID=A0A917SHM0_9ACTN|nr:ABC transporter ATP-binding protein [Microlunatus endophyticus]GGL82283.1 ABC transporter ATP-binding protein [Microlunatus endophyticus]